MFNPGHPGLVDLAHRVSHPLALRDEIPWALGYFTPLIPHMNSTLTIECEFDESEGSRQGFEP